MNAVKDVGFRYFAIATLLALGIATTIATGGGGSGGTEPPTLPPAITPPASGATLNITTANGINVATAVVMAIGVSFELGDITGENIALQSDDIQLSAPGKNGPIDFYKSLLPGSQQSLQNCTNGGSVDITVTQANINTISVGDHIIAVFFDCDDGLGYVIDGTVDMTIGAVQGDILTEVYLLGLDILMTDIVVTGSAGVFTADGGFTLTLDSMDFPVLRMSMAGEELRFGNELEIVTLTSFDHAMQADTGVFPEALVANVLGRLDSLFLGGSVDYSTPVAIEAVGDNDPHVGEILITGANDSSVRIVIIDNNSVRLDIDENGDSTIDTFVYTTWAELNGRAPTSPPPPPPPPPPPSETAVINPETAPILAREIYNAVTGFGSLTTAAGRQFLPDMPFVQLNEAEVSGEFGPMQLNCEVAGTAMVSGVKTVAGTFSSGDSLEANFDACSGGWDSVFGGMSFSIDGFSDSPDGAYMVSGSVAETSFQRVFGGTCFTGIGEFDTGFDAMYSATGYHRANSLTSDFHVWAGGRSQQLIEAYVSTQYWFVPDVVIVTRGSSGSMTGTDITGRFSYFSITPDEFIADNDPATGPYVGELMVTATDGSNMRMVAVDQLNLRLDLDYNGDLIFDESLPTMWATLAYDDMICP